MEPPFVGLLVFAIVGLSLTMQMQSGTAISCDLGDTITTDRMSNCGDCRKNMQTKCGLQGRVVSHLACNAPDPKNVSARVCEGCCQIPPPCPVQPPVEWDKCAATDKDESFRIENYKDIDCLRCRDGCKSRCDGIGASVGDQICGYLINGPTYLGLFCTCCCRENAGYPPPPPPKPSPPPPSPSPPPPTPENICELEDIYVAFRLSNNCNSCITDCKAKCSEMCSSMTAQECTQSSSNLCKCCCKTPPPSPSPPPPSPSPPPPSPPPPSPSPPQPSPSPPPPPRNICRAGDKFSEITYYNTNDCGICKSDCQTQCSASSMTKQLCTAKPTSVSCKCCCKGPTTSLLLLVSD